jgi:hypothetical protein
MKLNKRQENKARNRAARAAEAEKLAPVAAKLVQTNVAATSAPQIKGRKAAFIVIDDPVLPTPQQSRAIDFAREHRLRYQTKYKYDLSSRHCPPAPWPSTQNDFDQLRTGHTVACIDNRE